MKKSILPLLFLLFTGIAFSQTTVTLQDQCNCEVLKGTDVSSSGAVTPTGADLGDIYVNTNTGTIYFWDGDSWELTASDNQQITGFTFDDTTNILSLSLEDGGSVNVDLSSLSDVLTDSNTTVTSFDIDGTNTNLVITDSDANSYAVALADLAALINTDNQTLSEVLVQGNDANGLVLTGLGAPTTASDAATKAYVDSTADDDITGVSFDGGTNEVTVSEGSTSFSADLSSLEESADIAANASDIATNTTDIATNASNISTNTANITTNTTDIATNASDIATNTTDIAGNTADIATNTTDISTNTANITTNTTDIATNASDIATNTSNITTNTADIATNTTDIADHIAADGDLSATNEIQDIEEVLTDGNDANGLVLTGLGAPTAASDAATKAYVDSTADDDITGVSFDGGTNEVTVSEGSTSFSADLSSLEESADVAANASDIATNTADIAGNTSDIATNTTDIATNTANITTNTTDIATNASDIATNTSNITTNTADIATNTTDIADHIAADGDLSATNEIQDIEEVLTDGNDANGLVLTGLGALTAASDAATKAYVDSTADDDITGVSFDGGTNEVTVSEGLTSFSADLSSLEESADIAANASDIATNTADIAGNTSDIVTNTTDIATNASDIATNTTDIGTNATNIATNASDITTNAGNISTNATDIADHVAADGDLSATNEIQNIEEVLTDGNDANGLVLTGLGAPTAGSDAATKAYVDSVSDDDITGASLDAPSNVLTISEGTTDVTVDLSDLDDSAGVAANASDIATNTTDIGTNATNIATNTSDIATNASDIATNTTDIGTNATNIATNTSNIATNTSDIATNASDITTNATDISTNATDIANHVATDADTNIGNEYNTGSGITGGNLQITDGGGTESVNLISGDANNNITAGSDGALYLNVSSVSIAETNTTLSFNNATNELTYTNELGDNPAVDISSLDDSAGVAANASDIATNTTDIAGNTADIATNTTDISTNTANITTNTTDIATNASGITANAADIATNTADIATNTTDIADHIAADGDLSATNEIQDIEEVLTDGNDANGLVLTGLGAPTAASDAATKAYVDSTADDDITGVSFDGGTNEVTVSEGSTSFSADLSSLEESADIAANASDIATNTADIAGNTSDIATNTTDIATNASDIATNTADIAGNTSDIATNTTDIATNTANITTNTTDIATNASDIATNTSNITTNATDISTNATDIADHIAADGDLSATNEIQDIEEVLTDGNDANGLVLTGLGAPTAASDAATKAYVDSTADDDITGVSFDGGTNEVTVSEGSTSFSADLSSLEESADIAANASDIATNTADIAGNTSDIATNTTDIATNASNISTNTANITTNTTDIATNASDIATNTTDIGTNATNIATNTSDIATNASDITTNATDISTNATDIADHVAADGDLSSTNEIQNIEEVLTDGNDANGLVLTGLGAPTAGSDAATKAYVDSVSDDDITGASLDAPSNVLTISEGTTDVTVDLSDLDDSAGVAANASDIATNTTDIGTNATNIATNTSDIATNASDIATNTTDIGTNATNIATNTSNIATNTSDIATNASDITTNATDISTNATDIVNHVATDADTNIGNEYNTGSGITGGNLQITDGGGTESVNLISGDANNNITAGSDGALYLNVSSVSIAETNTTLSFNNATNELTYTNELGDNPAVDISSLDDSAGVAANASDIATNTTDIAGNTADIATNTTDISTNTANITTNTTDIATNASGITANAADIATNTADIATNTTDIADHIAADGDLSATNEIQDIEEVLTDGNDANGLVLTGLGAPTAGSDAATKAYVDSVSDDDITGASLDAPSNVLTISEGTTDVTVDLSDLDDSAGVAANASDIATNTTDIGTNATNIATNTSDIATNASDIATNTTDIGTNATNIATNTSDIATNASDITTNATDISTNATDIADHIAADGDLSATNEIQDIEEVLTDGNDANGLVLTGLGAPTAASDAATKAYVDSTADDDITGVSFDGGTNEVTVSEGSTSFSADLSSLEESADIAANASDIATNTTDIAGNTADIATNTTDISTNTANITTNTTDIATNASGITANAADIATNTADIATNTTDIATNTSDIATNTSDIATNTTDIATNASNISTNTANITTNTTDIATNASDIATNTTDIGTNASDITTNAGNISTNATDIADHVAADGDLSATNEIQNIEEVLTDGNDANGLVLTGLGAPTAGSDAATKAYVDSVSDDDITGASLDAPSNVLTISEGTTDVTVDLSDLDDSAGVAANASDIATNTTDIGTNATNIATNTSDIATNTTDIGTNATNIATNTSDIATNTTDIGTNATNIATNTSDIATNASDITTNAGNISTNATDIADHVAADGDLSSTNEIQNIEEVLTDGNDANGLVLTGLGAPTAGSDAATKAYVDSVSDDDITGASLDAPSNVLTISEGTTDVTVDLSDLDDSAGVAANASDIATNTTDIGTNATNIATNTSDIATNASDIATNTTDIGTNATNIATNTSDIATNTSDIATNASDITTNAGNISTNATDIADHVAADGDLSSTNEIQNIEEVLTDGNDANGLVLTGLGAPTVASDAATKAYVDSVSDDDITGASIDAPSNVLTISEGTTDVTVDLSDLDDSAGVAANASDIATNTTDIGTNATNIVTNASDIATNTTDIGTNATNIATNTSNIATNASDIATNTTDIAGNTADIATNTTDIADHIAADGDLSATNEIQNLSEVLADGNDGGGLAITNIADPINAQDAATRAYVDAQNASDIDSDTPVDVDGDGNTESTVEDVIQDIAPITSKAARIFYPPSIAIDASSNGTGRTVNLYAQYVAQYGTPSVASAGAPAAVPTYGATELYYYVTYADPTVFDNMSIDANGVLTYDIIGQPADYNALINVVFVVK